MMGSYHVKVTLGLCVKNNEKTISTTLQSICNQSYPFYCTELVVVDGMSRDNTLSIIRDYLESNAKFEYMILSDEGKGLAYARQMVLDNSNSGFIVWVDGDHILPKNYVQRQIDFMLKNPELGAAEAITFPAPNSNWIAKLEGCTWTVYGLKRIGRYLSSVGSAGVIYRKRARMETSAGELSNKAGNYP
ncbi:MAG: glycosyltransferase family A protein [Nitrososphaerota archaeon]